MRWCRSCIRTRPSPRSTVRSRTTSGVASSRTSTSISAPPGGPSGESRLDQRLAQQPVRVGLAHHLDDQAAGGVQELGGGRGLQQLATVQHDHVVADALELAEQVRGHQHRDAELVPDLLHQREHVVAGGRVEAVGRLVEQHQARVVHQRLRELGPLLHAGRVATHRPVPLLGEPHVAQHVGRALPRRVVGQPRHLAHVHHEVAGGHVRRQAVVLGHVADRRADRRTVAGDVVAEHRRRPAGRGDQPEQDLDQRGLAGAVGADQAGDPVTDGDVEPVERGDRRILLRQSDGLDHGHRFNLDGVPPCGVVPRSARPRLW